jgi:hypothetical protein
MRMTVEADIDGDEVLENMSIEAIAEHLEARRHDGDTEAPHLMLERVYYEFRQRGDAPKALVDYIYAVLGRIL